MPPKTLKDLPKEAKMRIASYLPGSHSTVEKVVDLSDQIKRHKEAVRRYQRLVEDVDEIEARPYYEPTLEVYKYRLADTQRQLAITNKKYRRAHTDYYSWLWDDSAKMRKDVRLDEAEREAVAPAHAEMG